MLPYSNQFYVNFLAEQGYRVPLLRMSSLGIQGSEMMALQVECQNRVFLHSKTQINAFLPLTFFVTNTYVHILVHFDTILNQFYCTGFF